MIVLLRGDVQVALDLLSLLLDRDSVHTLELSLLEVIGDLELLLLQLEELSFVLALDVIQALEGLSVRCELLDDLVGVAHPRRFLDLPHSILEVIKTLGNVLFILLLSGIHRGAFLVDLHFGDVRPLVGLRHCACIRLVLD